MQGPSIPGTRVLDGRDPSKAAAVVQDEGGTSGVVTVAAETNRLLGEILAALGETNEMLRRVLQVMEG